VTSPGRPSTGTRIDVRIPADLLAAIDAKAEAENLSRAVMIRHLLALSVLGESYCR
jgi:predicted DNA binding CopG/RHH family protein